MVIDLGRTKQLSGITPGASQERREVKMAKAKGLYRRGKIWWIRYAGPDGRIRFESTKTTSLKEAEYILACRRKEVREGKLPEVRQIAKSYTFRELAEEYLVWAKRQKSFVSKKSRVKQLVEVFGNYPLNSFSTHMIDKFQTERLARYKPASVNRLIEVLKHMFRKAEEWEMVGKEALEKVRRVKLIPENNRRLRFLSQEECQALIEKCDSHLRPIVITALNTGMRKGEILNLKWDQVDLKHGFILLEETKNGERREIPINKTLRQTLEGLPRHIRSPYVFWHGEEGKPYQEVKKSFSSALKKAGIKDFTFHDLRHCFASHLVMAGCDLKTVQELLGHKTLTMTLRYAHLAPSHKVKAVGILDKTLRAKNLLYKNYTIEDEKGLNQNG
jgi:integrase